MSSGVEPGQGPIDFGCCGETFPHGRRYKTLKKPTWSPPNWLFGPVWTLLYTAMGTASWLVWKNGGGAVPLTLYALQAVLNFAWSPLFFREHEITFALADISGAGP
jgi:benzodiazapine receptor